MPAQFAPRGVALAEINNDMNRGLTDALQMRVQQQMQNRGIEADRQMQSQRIMAQQQQQMSEFAFRNAQQQQEAKLQAERDSRLQSYDLEQLQKRQEADIAERTHKETGLTPDGIRQWAQAHSQATGEPMSFDQAYNTLAGYKREAAANEEMRLGEEDLRRRKAIELDAIDQKRQQALNSIRLWEQEELAKPENKVEHKAKAIRQYAADSVRETMTGYKRPMVDPEEDWKPIKDNNGGLIGYRIKKSDGTYDLRQPRNAGKSGSADSVAVDDMEVDEYLEKEFQRRFNATVGSDPTVPKDNVVGVWDSTDSKTGAGKYRPFTAEEVNSEERWAARLKLMAQKKQDIETMSLLDKYHQAGMPFDMAVEQIQKDRANAAQGIRIQQASKEAKMDEMANSTRRAQGKPEYSTGGQSQEARPLPPDPAQLKSGQTYRLKSGQIGRWTGDGFESVE